MSAAFALPLIERLPDGTYLSQLRGRRKYERTRIRVVEFSVKDADTGISEVFALITTLLDPEAHNAEQLARLYAERWRTETLFKILKVEVRATGAVLRSKTPAMVRQEIWGLLCCYQAVRQITALAAVNAKVELRRVRFPELFDAVRASVATVLAACDLAKAFRLLVEDLPRMLIRERPPRSTPRMLQRPGRDFPTRKPDTPKTRVVDRKLVLHRLPERPSVQ